MLYYYHFLFYEFYMIKIKKEKIIVILDYHFLFYEFYMIKIKKEKIIFMLDYHFLLDIN